LNKCQEVVDELDNQEPPSPASEIVNISQAGPVETKGSPRYGLDIGPYKNAIHLRDGLFSTIYKSERKSGGFVALKVTTPHLMSPPHNSDREAKILHSVSAPNIIQLVDVFWESGGHFVLVFPFMPYNLDELLHQNALNGWQMRSHLRDLFRALAHIHSFGIIHRDIKPSNVLLHSTAGPAYLADFGIAWWPEHNSSENPAQKLMSVGTTCYRPPEILFGDTAYDTSLDLWAAGCVVAEVVDVHHKPLFDSGPAGSELALVQSIFSTLGTPNSDIWPVRWVMTIYHSTDIESLLTCE
jgi:cyclin-dependent kinase